MSDSNQEMRDSYGRVKNNPFSGNTLDTFVGGATPQRKTSWELNTAESSNAAIGRGRMAPHLSNIIGPISADVHDPQSNFKPPKVPLENWRPGGLTRLNPPVRDNEPRGPRYSFGGYTTDFIWRTFMKKHWYEDFLSIDAIDLYLFVRLCCHLGLTVENPPSPDCIASIVAILAVPCLERSLTMFPPRGLSYLSPFTATLVRDVFEYLGCTRNPYRQWPVDRTIEWIDTIQGDGQQQNDQLTYLRNPLRFAIERYYDSFPQSPPGLVARANIQWYPDMHTFMYIPVPEVVNLLATLV
ncbi:uncharacterized protein EAF01_008939 [Botrytis porri]|uniref:Uncharacterized protein n=1 Tax=Botrytis porri TaxID=87229 RepID=A0A4Z1KRX5_9HELO|nr:uncharacterized protein EAF01_008939 [Botrytis porri]KAF7897973.1 hypothetical protein EAF01_008939 [Botrytis porri]TGO87404.1 hypothetical protein BPOR_0228g00060 [Botrytis porri]